MSKEYLTGEQKERIIEKIRYYIGLRMDNQEIISNLKDNNKIEISERTLRRYKQEIKEKSGKNIEQIFNAEIITNIINDICTYESLQKQSWIAYTKARTPTEQTRALSLVRNATTDKIKLLNNIPRQLRKSYIDSQENKETIQEANAEIKESKKFLEGLKKPIQY